MDPIGYFLDQAISKGSEIISEMPLGGGGRLARTTTFLTLSTFALGILLYKNHQENMAALKTKQQSVQGRISSNSILHSKASAFKAIHPSLAVKAIREEKETKVLRKAVVSDRLVSLSEKECLSTSLPPINRSDWESFEELKPSLAPDLSFKRQFLGAFSESPEQKTPCRNLSELTPKTISEEQSIKELNKEEIYKRNRRLILDEEVVQDKLKKNLAAAQEGHDDILGDWMADWWDKANYVDFCGVPKTGEKVSVHRYLKGTAAFGSLQGYRTHMEDEAVVEVFELDLEGGRQQATLYGVFDGHEGSECAEYLANCVASFLQTEFDKPFPRPVSDDVRIFNVCKRMFVFLGEEWRKKGLKAKSTACICLHIGNDLWTVNVGDSRAFLLVDGEVIGMSIDADPADPRFARGVLKRGGAIIYREDSPPRVGFKRGSDGYAVARAVGHSEYEYGMHARAKLTRHRILPNQEVTMVIGSDGLFDMGSTNQIAKKVLEYISFSCALIAKVLVKTAFQACKDPRIGDNITALVAKLKWRDNVPANNIP